VQSSTRRKVRAGLIGLALALTLIGIVSAAVLRQIVQIAPIVPPRAEDELPARLKAHLEEERFGIVTSTTGLPLGVRDGLRALFGSATLDIDEPGANPPKHTRRLAAAGCAVDQHCLVYYERAGARTWHAALFQWTPAATRFEWGGAAPAGLATIEEVRKAILSGAIKGPNSVW
jgi:hypothetical protein